MPVRQGLEQEGDRRTPAAGKKKKVDGAPLGAGLTATSGVKARATVPAG